MVEVRAVRVIFGLIAAVLKVRRTGGKKLGLSFAGTLQVGCFMIDIAALNGFAEKALRLRRKGKR